MKAICLDSEFIAHTRELLELSVFAVNGRELYHSLFKPRRARRWSSAVHGITPEDVAHAPAFRRCKERVQNIIDSASHIIGFAISNDIAELRASGIKRLDRKTLVEVRDLYWLCRGRHLGYNLFNGPGLGQCAADMGIEFTEGNRHSASGDTGATLRLYNELMAIFLHEHPEAEDMDIAGRWNLASSLIEQGRTMYFRDCAHGFVQLTRTEDAGVYHLKSSASIPDDDAETTVALIEVADRYTAEYELHTLFRNYSVKHGAFKYRLKSSMIEKFRRYKNVFDPQRSALHKRLLRARRR